MHIIWNMTTRDPADLHHLQRYPAIRRSYFGLITTKTPELENKEKVIARIHEAAKYVPA